MIPAERVSTPLARALRNVGWLLTGKGVGALLSLVYLGLATRSLGVERFGQFTLVLSTGQAVAALVGFRSWQMVIRFGVGAFKAGDPAQLGRLVRFCVLLDLAAAIAGVGIAAVAIDVMAPRLGWSDKLAHDALLFCGVLLLSVRQTAVGVLRLQDRFAAAAAADAVTPAMRFVGAIAAVLTGASIQDFLYVWAFSEFAAALTYWGLVIRTGPRLTGTWRDAARVPGEHPGLWHFAFVTNLNTTLNAAGRQVIVLLVGLLAGPAAAGGYRIAYQLSQALARLSDMFSNSIFPEFTRAHAGEERDDLRRLFRQTTRLTVGIGIAIALIAPIVGVPILHLVGGKAYVAAYPLLVLLSFAAALDLMGVGFEPVLLGTGHAAHAFRIRLVNVVVLFASAGVLMPVWQETGAAVATLLAALVGFVLFGRSAYRATR